MSGKIIFGISGEYVEYGAINSDGTNYRTFINSSDQVNYSNEISLTADGNKAVFADTDDNIKIISTDGTGTAVDLTNDDPTKKSAFAAISPDGLKVAYYQGNKLMLMDSDGTTSDTPVEIFTATEPLLLGKAPKWSPDGNRIAFYVQPGGEGAGLWVVDADGENPLLIQTVSSGDSLQSFDWSPDGGKIAFSYGSGGLNDIYVANADGSESPTDLTNTEDESEYGPVWSPNGADIMYHTHDTISIYDSLAETLSIEETVSGDSSIDSTDWSPDGAQIVFIKSTYVSPNPGYTELYVENVGPSGPATPISGLPSGEYMYGVLWVDGSVIPPTPPPPDPSDGSTDTPDAPVVTPPPPPPPPVPPIFSITGAEGKEGDVLAFTVTRGGGTDTAVSVGYSTVDGTATADEDYTAQSGFVTFAAGETSKTIEIQTVDSIGIEPTENFAVKLYQPSDDGAIDADTATGTIKDKNGKALDLYILEDASCSFADDIATLAGNDSSFQSLFQELPGINVGVGSFVDKPIFPFGEYDDYLYRNELSMTADSQSVAAVFDNLQAMWGDDEPEGQLEALLQTAKHSDELGFRQDTVRMVVLCTDAGYHQAGDGNAWGLIVANNGDGVADANEDYASVEQLKNALTEADIFPVFAIAGGDANLALYNNLVAQLGIGAVVSLNSDSSNFFQAVQAGVQTHYTYSQQGGGVVGSIV